jgi:hypothetical protein
MVWQFVLLAASLSTLTIRRIFMTDTFTLPDPVMFRANIIRTLAQKRPELCDYSGRAFWPIPVMIPVVLAKCLHYVHREWFEQVCKKNYEIVSMLSLVRTGLTRLCAEGDLGEDHAGIYMREHPTVTHMDIFSAPFFTPYSRILTLCKNAFELLGFVYSIEAGSLEAIKALVELRMIANGEFAKLHMTKEVEHERIAEEIRRLISCSPYLESFNRGCQLHNLLYEEVVAK